MRPSPGTVPNDGRALGWSVISVLGPMGRTVADTAFLMGASIGQRPDGSSGLPSRWLQQSGQCVMLIYPIYVLATQKTLAFVLSVKSTVVCSASACRPSHRWLSSCEPVDLNFAEADRAFDILRAENFVAAFADTWRKNPENLGPNIRANMDIASAITLADRAWAHLEQSRIMRAFAAATEKYDLILSPVVPITPFPWTELYAAKVDNHEMKNYYHWLGLTYVVTLATNPTIALTVRQG
jgi:amidase